MDLREMIVDLLRDELRVDLEIRDSYESFGGTYLTVSFQMYLGEELIVDEDSSIPLPLPD